MSREVRRVPANWQHPKYDAEEVAARGDYLRGRYKPLRRGYEADASDFLALANAKGLQEAVDYFGQAPNREHYMPDWPDAERTHLMMYETTSEGTPISPSFATPEELARWLADSGASAFGSSGATYEQWLSAARRGWSPSAVMEGGRMMSGVEALAVDLPTAEPTP